MFTDRLIAASLGFVFAAAGAAVQARAQDYVSAQRTYYLHAPSSYQQGCFGECACPLSNRETMVGSFILDLITVGDATDFYSITDIVWHVPQLGGNTFDVTIEGAGTFAAGQSPWNSHQHANLTVTLAPYPPPWAGPQQFSTTPTFNTRTVAPPVIDLEVTNSATGCPGIRLRIVASWYRSDFNGDGTIAVPDIFAFLNAWFLGDPSADFNGSGGLSTLDIFDFLNGWFAGV